AGWMKPRPRARWSCAGTQSRWISRPKSSRNTPHRRLGESRENAVRPNSFERRRSAHAERAMRGIGYDTEEAYIVADHAIDAALCGYEYSGLAKLLNIPEHRRFKEPRRPTRVLRENEVSVLYDGGNNVGILVIYHSPRR